MITGSAVIPYVTARVTVFFGNSAPIRDSPGRLYLLAPAADSLKKVMS